MDVSNNYRQEEAMKHPNDTDVLSGRGKFTTKWKGNIYFRTLVEHHKSEYLKAGNNLEKKQIAQKIIDTVRMLNPQGRFLKHDADKNMWYDIGNHAALRKTRQALREGSTNSIDASSGKESTDEETLNTTERTFDQNFHRISSLASSLDNLSDDVSKVRLQS